MLLRHEGFRRLCRARDVLRESREPSPTIEQLAREVRISPFHFIRQFEAVFGVTPHQFRIASRIDVAKQLLAAGEHSVTDVCMEVGFSSLGSFSALFARPIGETDVPLLGMATGEGIACLNHLVRRGEVTRSLDADGVAWYRLAAA